MSRRATVKVKKTAVTRAEAVAEFGRKKARQRRKLWHRRVIIVGVLACVSYMVVGCWWLVHTGRVERGIDAANVRFWGMTASMGFTLKQINLAGRQHADIETIRGAIGLNQGDPILSAPLIDIKARLETIPEIKQAAITRTLPGTLSITLIERQPAAWWQADGKVQLIDREGIVLSQLHYKARQTLPVVVGADAPKHMAELSKLLDISPSLKADVTAAIRIGSRRWNIQLARDITVLLPEEKPDIAWKRFARMVEQKALLSKAIRSVDLRMEDRVFIMPIEQHKSPITMTNFSTKDI